MNNKENYPTWLVTSEIAKELKGIGFNKSCILTCKDDKLNIELFVEEYVPFTSKLYILKTNADRITNIDFDFYVPTWEQVFEWFREKKLFTVIEYEGSDVYTFRIVIMNTPSVRTDNKKYFSYEEAREALIKELIRIYKNGNNI